MDYEDFSIWFEPEHSGYYCLVARSSNGESVRGSFALPTRRDELGRLLRGLGVRVREPRGLVPTEVGTQPTPQAFGARLFEALFQGRVRTLFDRCLGRLGAKPGQGLRLRLHFDLEHRDLVCLASLPWEMLYSNERGFLSLSRFTPIVRHLSLARPARAVGFEQPLSVLVTMCPSSAAPLDLEAERKAIENAWGRHDRIRPVFLERATLADLRRKLAGPDAFHVLHFMGHGDLDLTSGQGTLVFNDDDGGDAPVSGHDLATLLADRQDLQLVFLNACDTARPTTDDGLDPFAGIATALIKSGVSATVAMQFPISDRAAIAFSEAFYEQVGQSRDLETATAEGRQAILSQDRRSHEWVTPVLFERFADIDRLPPKCHEPSKNIHGREPDHRKCKPLLGRREDDDFVDVVIIYNGDNKNDVFRIARWLEHQGIKTWLEDWHLQPGRRSAEVRERILTSSHSAAIFLGASGMEPWQHEEYYTALERSVTEGHLVIPVLLPGVGKAPKIPAFLNNRARVCFEHADDQTALTRLEWAINTRRSKNNDRL